MKFAKNLALLRKSAGFTQQQLADILNVSFQTVSHWEHGYCEPSLSQLIQLKVIFAVSYEELLD